MRNDALDREYTTILQEAEAGVWREVDLEETWSDAARAASIEARRRRANLRTRLTVRTDKGMPRLGKGRVYPVKGDWSLLDADDRKAIRDKYFETMRQTQGVLRTALAKARRRFSGKDRRFRALRRTA